MGPQSEVRQQPKEERQAKHLQDWDTSSTAPCRSARYPASMRCSAERRCRDVRRKADARVRVSDSRVPVHLAGSVTCSGGRFAGSDGIAGGRETVRSAILGTTSLVAVAVAVTPFAAMAADPIKLRL